MGPLEASAQRAALQHSAQAGTSAKVPTAASMRLMQAGSPGTSVLNLTCTTHTWASEDPPRRYLVSLCCSWLLGEAAPEDGQYFLYYRYGARTEACQEYGVDALGRHVACRVPSTFISSKGLEWLAVRVNGSSRRAAIRPLDQLFALPAIDRVNPPGNVTATAEGSCLSVHWEKPVSAFPTHCFDYEVRIHNERKDYLQTEKMQNTTFVGITDGASRHAIRVRAAVSARCRPQGSWGEWSRTVYAGTDEWRPWTGWLLTVLMATACLGLLLLSLACRLCHLWPRLFPPVPAPKNTIKDFFMALEYEVREATLEAA
ncbi:interleukin-5 receptor subunit alpha [Talpa occidentalis]|uniref:interleukin-5 receptor subunit alpha n=1 Tax=Talpa occidentalis TaxID=50954 RepID=UPI0023F6CCC0|nr:interleukin-5 receptor subunit alpha [Talpa occidentalis]